MSGIWQKADSAWQCSAHVGHGEAMNSAAKGGVAGLTAGVLQVAKASENKEGG